MQKCEILVGYGEDGKEIWEPGFYLGLGSIPVKVGEQTVLQTVAVCASGITGNLDTVWVQNIKLELDGTGLPQGGHEGVHTGHRGGAAGHRPDEDVPHTQ